MRLINASTLTLHDFLEGHVPPYAILSHTWGADEVSYQELSNHSKGKLRHKAGYQKIEATCRLAKTHGLDYAWVDTCCIDKSSSAELQEAVNSMYAWYARAELCYVYLVDLLGTDLLLQDPGSSLLVENNDKAMTSLRRADSAEPRPWNERMNQRVAMSGDDEYQYVFEELADCVWFKRGWTLQELIAPRHVLFFAKDWRAVGVKSNLVETLSRITGVPTTVLNHKRPVNSESVAARMSWAAQRNTSRVEDMAYSLLGIFDVSMPMLYGEGKKAFARLQEEIIRFTPDLSIFAWWSAQCPLGCLLAQSPADFARASNIVAQGWPGQFQMTNQGLVIEAAVVEEEVVGAWGQKDVRMSLCCRAGLKETGLMALRLRSVQAEDGDMRIVYHVAQDSQGSCPHTGDLSDRLAEVNPLELQRRQIIVQRRVEGVFKPPIFRIFPNHPRFRVTKTQPRDLWDREVERFPRTEPPLIMRPTDLEAASGSLVLTLVNVRRVHTLDASWSVVEQDGTTLCELSISFGFDHLVQADFGGSFAFRSRRLMLHACDITRLTVYDIDTIQAKGCEHVQRHTPSCLGLAAFTEPIVTLRLDDGRSQIKIRMREVMTAQRSCIDLLIDHDEVYELGPANFTLPSLVPGAGLNGDVKTVPEGVFELEA